jgi:hypothetical protein
MNVTNGSIPVHEILKCFDRHEQGIVPFACMHAHVRTIVRRLVKNDLPLGMVRLGFMTLAFVFAIVAGGPFVKIWTKYALLSASYST